MFRSFLSINIGEIDFLISVVVSFLRSPRQLRQFLLMLKNLSEFIWKWRQAEEIWPSVSFLVINGCWEAVILKFPFKFIQKRDFAVYVFFLWKSYLSVQNGPKHQSDLLSNLPLTPTEYTFDYLTLTGILKLLKTNFGKWSTITVEIRVFDLWHW